MPSAGRICQEAGNGSIAVATKSRSRQRLQTHEIECHQTTWRSAGIVVIGLPFLQWNWPGRARVSVMSAHACGSECCENQWGWRCGVDRGELVAGPGPQGWCLRTVAADALVSSSVLRRAAGADPGVAAGFAGVARAEPDMAVIQMRAGRPR